jgi:hypothetical protein
VKDTERVIQLHMRFTFDGGKMQKSPKQRCLELAKQELPGAGLFAVTALAGKIYRASFPKPFDRMSVEDLEMTEKVKQAQAAVAA